MRQAAMPPIVSVGTSKVRARASSSVAQMLPARRGRARTGRGRRGGAPGGVREEVVTMARPRKLAGGLGFEPR